MKDYFFRNFHIFIKKLFISVVIWDFDGTLFQSEEFSIALENAYRKYLEEYKKEKISPNKFRILSSAYGSWSKCVSSLTGISEFNVIKTIDNSIDKIKYIHKNDRLIEFFKGLKRYKHIILTNAKKTYVYEGLIRIGFSPENGFFPFEFIVDPEDMRCLKPDLNAFRYVHNLTKLPKYRHLMIGDSYKHDILPARSYGFFALHVKEFVRL